MKFQDYSKFRGISLCSQAELRLESVKNCGNNLQISVEEKHSNLYFMDFGSSIKIQYFFLILS